jgi:hypothetical protein
MSVRTVVLVFVIWCLASVPAGIFIGRFIAGPRRPR